jgi:spindle assembly abnormal protein 6
MERVIRFEMSDECNLLADSSETHQSTFIATDIPQTPTPMIHFPLMMTADRGRTQSTMMQTISQKAAHSSGGRKLHSREMIDIPSRPIELYELEVGESDFENLRRDQALLVDFHDFANSLISLMQFCEMGDISDSMPPPQQQQQQQQQQQDQCVFPATYVGGRDTQTDNHHTSQHQWGNNNGSWSTPSQAQQQGRQGMLPRMTSPYGKLNPAKPHISKYTCRLERESSASSDEGNQWKNATKSSPSCARFSIVESNQFRELTHLALSLNVGTDKSVRLYLSSRLSQAMAQTRRVQSICEEHQHRSNTAETELISLRKVVHDLTQSSEAEKRQLRYQTEEQLQATNSSHSAEINEVKVAKDAEIKVLIERSEKNRLVHENKIRLLEDVNAKINAEKLASENETERLATKLSFHEATNNALSNELNSLRGKLQHVSEEKSSIEKSLHQLQLQLSSLHYSNDSQEKMISQTESSRISAEQVSADAKRTLSSQHSQMEDLRRKLEEAELETLKYKDLTSRYQTNRLEMKKRLKEKVEMIRESSDVLVVKEKESSELKGQVRSLEEKLQRVQSEKDAASRELSDALRQMKEDKTKLENNQQVRASILSFFTR